MSVTYYVYHTLNNFLNSTQGKVLVMLRASAQPRRATDTPNLILSICSIWWASLLMMSLTPDLIASLTKTSGKSKRLGQALISSIVLFFTHSSNMVGQS